MQTSIDPEMANNPRSAYFERGVIFIRKNWWLASVLALGIYVSLPFMAPLFMHIGWFGPARIIYGIYATQCHQLPERSYFLFGSKLTYPLIEIQHAWKQTTDPLVLRQFIGTPEMGWKVAWSDRMVAMFTSLWLFGLLWKPLRHRIKPLRWQWLALFIIPLALDGTSHLISDFAGIGQGFRDSNSWLAVITNYSFPTYFYMGDAWGSFNSIMRLLSGIMVGLGVVWFCFPRLDDALAPEIMAHSPIETTVISKLYDNIDLGNSQQ